VNEQDGRPTTDGDEPSVSVSAPEAVQFTIPEFEVR
jgi:hypothetical protein